MQWIKAKDKPPASEWKGPVRFDHKDGQWTYGIRSGLQMDYASGVYEDLEWLDESTPASAEDEAARLYPYDVNGTEPELDMMADLQRLAHITCARMYTGEIERLNGGE